MSTLPDPIRLGNFYPPQILNKEKNEWEILTGSDGAYKAQTIQTVVADYFSGSSNMTKVLDEDMHGVSIFNNSANDLTFTIDGVTRPVFAKGSYQSIFKQPFREVSIAANGAFYIDLLQQLGAAVSVIAPEPPDTTAPDNVTNLEYSNVTQNSVTLIWTASLAPDTSGYEIWQGGSLTATVTATTFTAVGLTPSTQYTYTVKAKDRTGNVASGTSKNVTTAAQPADTTPPNNVTGLMKSNVTQTGVTLVWTASDSNDVKDYRIYNGSTLIATVTTLSYGVTGLTPETTYTFTIKARDTSNNEASGVSIGVTTAALPADTTPPENVTGLTKSNVTQTGVTLTWVASVSSDTKDYRIYNGSTLITTVTGLTYNVTGLTADTDYTFTVKARDNANNEASGVPVNVRTAAAPPVDPPEPVSNLKAGTPTATTIPITFAKSPSAGVTALEMAYSKDGTNFTIANASVNPNSTSFEFTGLTANTPYTLRVVAIDGTGKRSTAVTAQATTAVQAVVSTEIYDSFNRADSSVSMGATTTQNKTWTPYSGTWGIEGNRAKKFSATKAFTVIPSGISDGIIEVQYAQLAFGQKVVFRSMNNLNQFEFNIESTNQYSLTRSLAGGGTTLTVPAKVFAQAGDVIRIILNGTSIKININGIERFSGTDTNHVTEGNHGLSGETDNAAKWEYFLVKSATDNAPLISVMPHGGEFGVSIDVALTSDKPSTIYYTIDGIEPTLSSSVYTTPITIDASKTLKYFGVNTATGEASIVKSVDYTITPIAPLTTDIVTNSLHLWYDALDGADTTGRLIKDRTGKGNHGAVKKGPTPSAWTSSGLNIKDAGFTTNRPFNVNGESYSIEMYVEFKEAPSGFNKTLLAHRGTDSNDGFVINHADGTPNLSFLRLKNGGNSVSKVLLANYSLNTKYHMVVVAEKLTGTSTKYTGYVNGTQIFTVTDPNDAVLRATDTLTYGFVPTLAHDIQSTLLYSTRIYTKALTAVEVTKNYAYEQAITRI